MQNHNEAFRSYLKEALIEFHCDLYSYWMMVICDTLPSYLDRQNYNPIVTNSTLACSNMYL